MRKDLEVRLMRRELTTLLTLVIAGAAIAGCSPAGSASPSVAASPSAAAGTDLCEAAGDDGSVELPAGDYQVDATDPVITLTLPAGFTAGCADGTVSLFGPEGSICST